MASNEIHLSDVGTAITVTIAEDDVAKDISNATVTFIFYKPSGTEVHKTASFVTDGTDGKARYIMASGDLDEQGQWSLQAYVDFGDTAFYSEITEFTVHRNIGSV